ncbi:ComEC/Rec2 family competence protein [Anaerocolumna jejuensis]|uniref:ComEC/Rec2 family competence protein n=1 Tax=Anaerocolumna jejuensis TaxID=259063 RepID=UPI003F7C2F17
MGIKRPFIWILASYLAGLAVYEADFKAVLAAGTGMLLAILVWLLLPQRRRQRLTNYSFLLLLPLLFLMGYMQINKELLTPAADKAFKQKHKARAQGEVSLVEETEKYTRLTIKESVLSIEGGGTYQDLKLLVYIDDNEKYRAGNKVEVSGSVIKFTKASNPGQFNEYLFYRTKKYHYKFYAESVTILNSKINSYHQTLFTIRKQLTATYYKLLSEKNAGILTAMMLGDTNNLDADIKELYRENGISHILAISGLHISLLGLTLYKIFRRLRVPLFLSTAFTLLFLYSYGILTGFGVSTNRAVVMMGVYMAALLVGRTYDLLSGTAFSALIILLQSPLEITSAGFLLSFGAVIGIGTVYPALQNALSGKEMDGQRKPDRQKKPDGQKKSDKQRKPDEQKKPDRQKMPDKKAGPSFRKAACNLILQTLLTSLSAQLILLPILLWFFYEMPAYSLFVNLLIIPLSSLLTILAFITVLAGCISVPLGVFLMGSVNYILEFYEGVCRLGSKLPYKSILTGRPEILVILIFYAALFFFVQWNKKKGRRLSLLLLLSFVILLVPVKERHLEVVFLDVGQGDGIFLRFPDGTTMLVDGGSSDVKELGKYRLEPFLKYKGIKRIDYAVITHGDSDHYSGVLEFMQPEYKGDIRIKHLILPGVSLKGEAYHNLIQAAEKRSAGVSVLSKGDSLERGGVYLSCLWPDKGVIESSGEASDTNSHSIVLSLRYLEFDLLLTGDLEGMGEGEVTKEIEEGKPQKRIPIYYDILKVAHHGSKYSSGSEFLHAAAPAYSIISCGADNSYGHPHKETLKRLMDSGCRILQTPESGAVMVITDGKNMRIEEWSKGG